MRNPETKKLTRNEMKSVLGGVGRVCFADNDCPPGEYCNSEGNRNKCAKTVTAAIVETYTIKAPTK